MARKVETGGFEGVFFPANSLEIDDWGQKNPIPCLETDFERIQSAVSCIILSPLLKFVLPLFERIESTAANEIHRVSMITSSEYEKAGTMSSYKSLRYHSTIAWQEYFDSTIVREHAHCRLGRVKEDIFIAEPYLRETDYLIIDFDCLKKSEYPAKHGYNPIGLTVEELCNLIYFASNGSCEKVFIIGYSDTFKAGSIEYFTHLELIKHLSYYFLKGREQRKFANLEGPNVQELHIQMDEYEHPLLFKHNQLSNKWWLCIWEGTPDKRCFSCYPEDYIQATKGVLTDHVLEILSQ